MLEKNFFPIFQELLKFLPKKLSPSPQKYGFGIRDPEKTYSGSRGQNGTGPRIRIRNTEKNTVPTSASTSETAKFETILETELPPSPLSLPTCSA
jgi:hypothetical protein